MLKGIGLLMILCGSSGLGFVLAGELEKRIQELQEMLQLVTLLKGEIRYLHQPLPDAFLHISMSAKSPFREFFFNTAQDLQSRSGKTAQEVWQMNQKTYLSNVHLTKKEYEELKAFGGMLGYLDVEMQLNTVDYYMEQLRNSVSAAMELSRSRRRLYQYLGVLSGFALVLLIL